MILSQPCYDKITSFLRGTGDIKISDQLEITLISYYYETQESIPGHQRDHWITHKSMLWSEFTGNS